MRSKGRSRPMSATLTTKRKSARDRPASSKRERGDWGRESGRLTEELEVERRGVTLAEKTNAREKARAAANLMTQSRNLLVSRHSSRLARSPRPPPVVIHRRSRGRSAPRHARRDDQREREGPCRSQLNDAAIGTPSLSSVNSINSRSRRPPPVIEPMMPPPCSPSIIVRRASLPRPSPAPSSSRLDTLSLCAALVCLSRRHRRHTCMSRARAHA